MRTSPIVEATLGDAKALPITICRASVTKVIGGSGLICRIPPNGMQLGHSVSGGKDMDEIIGIEAQSAPTAADERVGFAVTHNRNSISTKFPVDEEPMEDIELDGADSE